MSGRSETELLVRPILIGADFNTKLTNTANAVKNLHDRQSAGISDAIHDVRRLEGGYSRLANAINTSASVSGSMVRNLMSVQSAIVGFAAYGAGRTIIEQTIGRQDQIARARLQLGAILQDAELLQQSEARALRLTQEIAGIDYTGAMRGLAMTINLAGGSVDRAAELVKLAKALESISPEQGFEGALFALKELESGDAMSLRERFGFRLLNGSEAQEIARQNGQTLNEYYFGELERQLDRRYAGGVTGAGVEALLSIDNATLSGQINMLSTAISDIFAQIGADAYSELTGSGGIARISAELDRLKLDPEFRQGVRDLAANLSSVAESAIELAVNLPQNLLAMRDFLSEYGDILKTVFALYAANRLTDGALGRGAGALAGYASRGLSSRLGGQAGALAQGLESAAIDAQPVRVVNWSEMPGAGGLPGAPTGPPNVPNVPGAGEAAGTGAMGLAARYRAFGFSGLVSSLTSSVGSMTILGAGILAGAAALYAQLTFVGGLNEEMQGTLEQLEREAEAARDLRERQQAMFEASQNLQQTQNTYENSEAAGPLSRAQENEAMLRSFISSEILPSLMTGQLDSSSLNYQSTLEPILAEARSGIEAIFGGENTVFSGSENQSAILATLNTLLAEQGLRFNVSEGQSIREGSFQSGIFTKEFDSQVSRIERAYSRLFDTATGQARGPAEQQVIENLRQSGELDRLLRERDKNRGILSSSEAAAQILNRNPGATPRREVVFQNGAVQITVNTPNGLLTPQQVTTLQQSVEELFVEAARSASTKE
jgi:hypothetical protein